MAVFDTLSTGICADIQQRMRQMLVDGDPVSDPIIERILVTTGKCVRPLFMRLVTEHVGGSWHEVNDAAMAVEAIHLASLLHDDVVDEADLRRGDPTLNARHSDKVSVLFGDYIFVTALKSANRLARPESVTVLFDAVRRMIRGEITDTIEDGYIDEEQYFRIISDKTASLFAAAGELVVLLTGGTEAEREWAAMLGELVGSAFQVVDDTLDYTGVPVKLGKPAESDLLAGTVTLPLIHALKGVADDERKRFLSGADLTIEERCAFVRERGGVTYALGRAGEMLNEARTMIVTQGKNDASQQAFEQFFRMIHAREA